MAGTGLLQVISLDNKMDLMAVKDCNKYVSPTTCFCFSP